MLCCKKGAILKTRGQMGPEARENCRCEGGASRRQLIRNGIDSRGGDELLPE